MEKSKDEVYSALDKIAYNNYQWSCERNEIKKAPAGVYELDAMSMFNAKFDALTRKMDKLSMKVDSLIGGSSHTEDVGVGNMHCINDFPSYGQEFGNEHVTPPKAQGKLPCQPENPREHCKAVILRSGKIWGNEKKDEVEEEKKKEDEDKNESISNHDKVNEEANKKNEVEKEEEEKYVPPPPYKPPFPYSQRFQKAKLDKQFGKFLKVLKKLYINIPFTDAISQMPSYAKFLKEILSNKRRLEDYETVALTEECSALLQNKLPPKLKDPESFSIPCHIGDTSIEKALCDLGASVNLMPLSICEKLKVGDLKPNTISLQLADRSIKYPVGILENTLKKHLGVDPCLRVVVIDEIVEAEFKKRYPEDPLENCLVHSSEGAKA
ncbi:uncharacterized protein LOC131178397 [Hevea brasiliensis]|uniref:uncharacterized protein LOC131178397 n=1 Tax=Hevea brasiliensis TaxID=3981 RepID=UPI0025FCB476|nr:uncharacterized protein LOC131178397 [Hevea brasiliensis]